MTPTRWTTLAGCVLVAGALGFLLASTAYGDLPPLPGYAPLVLLLLAVFELGLARVVRSRVRGTARPGARPLHPLQVARAAALAKASSPTGALLLGGYAGFTLWLLRSTDLAAASDDVPVAAASAVTALALVAGALLLERACRTPRDGDGPGGGGRGTGSSQGPRGLGSRG